MDYVVPQAPLSMELSRKQHWSALPFAALGDLPDPETEPASPASPALAGRFFSTESPEKSRIFLPYPLFSCKAPKGNWIRRQLQVCCLEKALGIYGSSLRKSEDKAFRGMWYFSTSEYTPSSKDSAYFQGGMDWRMICQWEKTVGTQLRISPLKCKSKPQSHTGQNGCNPKVYKQ